MYLMSNESIYCVAEEKSYSIEEFDVMRWLDVLSENTQFSIKNKLVEINELASYHRKVTYQLMESFSEDLKISLMMEYESKFGNMLLSEDVLLIESWFNDAYSWTKDKISKTGNWITDKVKDLGTFGIKTGKDFMTCITSGSCSPLFEDFREMLYSPVGIAIETFLAATGIGQIGPIVAWGMMLLYDGYLLITGASNGSWLNLIFDILGVGLGSFAKGARAAFGGASAVQKTAGKGVAEVVGEGLKNPRTAEIMVKLKNLISKGLGKLMGPIQTAAKFLSEKLGLKWVSKVLDSISGQIAKLLEAFGVKAVKGTTKAGVKSGIKTGTMAQGFVSAAETKTGRNLANKVASTFGQNPYDDIMNANKKYGVDYSGVEL